MRAWRTALPALGMILTLAPAAGASVPRAPMPVAFDSIVVSTSVLSPNGDGVLDRVRFTYRLDDSTSVTVFVAPAGGSDTLAVLLAGTVQRPDTASVVWDGRDRAGAVVPDGAYDVHFTGRTTDMRSLANRRSVRVDTRPPEVEILEVKPQVLIPSLPGRPAAVRVRVAVRSAEARDSLRAVVRAGRDSFALALVDGFQGNGEYVATCAACTTPALRDGVHTVVAEGLDRAGNRSRAQAWLDKNALGPDVRILYPSPQGRIAVQNADSIAGTAYDRHGIATLRLRLATASDTLWLDPALRLPAPPDTLVRWRADVAAALAAEGSWALRVTGTDALGVVQSDSATFDVDRTPPSKPVLEPRPAILSISPAIDVALRVDATMHRLVRQGGAAPADTVVIGDAQTRLVLRAVALATGTNALAFTALDRAGNVSQPETTTVVLRPGAGISAPERFRAGNAIQVDVGPQAAPVTLRIYAVDGALVRAFRSASQRVHTFTWDLRTGDGRHVKNGAYLLRGSIGPRSGGPEDHVQKLIAVVE